MRSRRPATKPSNHPTMTTYEAIRADMIRIANMRADLEQIAGRRPNDKLCLYAIRAADDSLTDLARRLSALAADVRTGQRPG